MAERLTAREAIGALTADFTESAAPAGDTAGDGPLGWAGYADSRARATARTGEQESVVHGTATVGGHPCVLISFEFGFLGGSLGQRTGDRLEAAYEEAITRRLPLVSLIATGGSRMQEGMIALTQLHRVARASARLRAAGPAQLAVLRDPTTGGGWATLGAGADVILALPGAQVGFAGSRVRPADADPAAYGAEGQLAAGSVDAIVPPGELPATVGRWLGLLAHHDAPPAPAPVPDALGATDLPRTGWDAVLRARAADRPRAGAYLDAYFGLRLPLSGDRCGGTDPGLLCGFGLREGRPVAYVAQCGTATRPAGYRTAARVIRLADRLGIPVLTLVDTPGAANDAEAERSGAGAAIADAFASIAAARVPVTTLVIGEGGSGGALALAAPDRTHVTPDSYFSVIAPELAAAILKRDPDRVRATAGQLRLRPQDLVDLGVARSVAGAPGRRAGAAEGG
ncbi:carboxyl transferase domain-containing protein [Streptomyces castrisilvae]|uniref:Acetyl-coenzyme A carboxylase carboxyl transferase subunits beta/alpha n=1 Tax=Streptomyces castrisilvae TaxID=3033811 RepID=A0ABY9HJC1_9ACTN|nr:carboxyl transferase domain-containing protein [Streptomyces sp. Mut1]WLQ33661.1 carboxyl transferase domain-containing protein [Streptomyces sp. Mut1]